MHHASLLTVQHDMEAGPGAVSFHRLSAELGADLDAGSRSAPSQQSPVPTSAVVQSSNWWHHRWLTVRRVSAAGSPRTETGSLDRMLWLEGLENWRVEQLISMISDHIH